MKRILDSSFKYRASFATDVRKTFERVRRQQQQEREAKARADAEATKNVEPLKKRKATG